MNSNPRELRFRNFYLSDEIHSAILITETIVDKFTQTDDDVASNVYYVNESFHDSYFLILKKLL